MNKFWALTITAKLELKRQWMNSEMVIAFLQENKGGKVYRSGTDQEAEIIADPQNELVWKDIPQVG